MESLEASVIGLVAVSSLASVEGLKEMYGDAPGV
jgi:hypothetical protein